MAERQQGKIRFKSVHNGDPAAARAAIAAEYPDYQDVEVTHLSVATINGFREALFTYTLPE